MAQSCELGFATWRLDANLSASGNELLVDRYISLFVITCIADATSVNFSGALETDVTSIFINSSKDNFFNSLAAGSTVCAKENAGTRIQANAHIKVILICGILSCMGNKRDNLILYATPVRL